jgi:hypothetical protein
MMVDDVVVRSGSGPSTRAGSRFLATFEALIVTASVPVSYKALNLPKPPVHVPPGLAMIVAVLGLLLILRRSPASRGLESSSWRQGLNVGVVFAAGMLPAGVIVLNPARFFEGHWELDWTMGAAALIAGLLYGYLRETTGRIRAGAGVHGVGGV